jgi:hypothetical protein
LLCIAFLNVLDKLRQQHAVSKFKLPEQVCVSFVAASYALPVEHDHALQLQV